MNTPNEKMEKRIKMFDDVMHFRKPEHVPVVANATSWPIFDSDLHPKMSEALSDWNLSEKIYREFAERYDFDSYAQMPGRYDKALLDTLQVQEVVFDDDANTVNWAEKEMMTADEYDAYQHKRHELYWTAIIPRRYPKLTKGSLLKAYDVDQAHKKHQQKVAKFLKDEYHAPLQRRIFYTHPMEMIFELRGIKGFSIDLRRKKSQIKEIVDSEIESAAIAPTKFACENPDREYVNQIFGGALGQTILNHKQFEELYWPTIKGVAETASSYGCSVGIQWQGALSPKIDFFQDLPKQSTKIEVEEDIIEMRKALPDQCLMGGIPIAILGRGTKEEVVSHVKNVLDSVGDKGIILSSNQTLAFPNDATRENLKAVIDFVRDYQM